uniref:Uncharacterized protein n=1 Tax=Heterorhabditis bacteriophora TaxID=37862 RepID=A0A1I7W7M8_HETBA
MSDPELFIISRDTSPSEQERYLLNLKDNEEDRHGMSGTCICTRTLSVSLSSFVVDIDHAVEVSIINTVISCVISRFIAYAILNPTFVVVVNRLCQQITVVVTVVTEGEQEDESDSYK